MAASNPQNEPAVAWLIMDSGPAWATAASIHWRAVSVPVVRQTTRGDGCCHRPQPSRRRTVWRLTPADSRSSMAATSSTQHAASSGATGPAWWADRSAGARHPQPWCRVLLHDREQAPRWEGDALLLTITRGAGGVRPGAALEVLAGAGRAGLVVAGLRSAGTARAARTARHRHAAGQGTPADLLELRLRDPQLGLAGDRVVREGQRDPLQLRDELGGQALLELADRPGVDLLEP